MNQARDHLGEDAALYALGALDDAARELVDEHVAVCAACAHLLGRAEADVTAMVEADRQTPAPSELQLRVARSWRAPQTRPVWATYAAVAAGLLVGVLPSAYFWQQSQATHNAMVADSDAMNRLATTPFKTAAFGGMDDGATARVMYATNGSWYVVLVHGASTALQVAWMHDGQRTMLGTPHMHGDVAMLYLPKSHRMDQLALVDGERIVGQAQLVF